MDHQYLFVLGRNPELSRAELKNFCDEVLYDKEKSLFIGKNLRFENPRNIPREKEQLFLDRLGGVIRFAEIVGEYSKEKEILNTIIDQVREKIPDGKIHLGVSAWGCGRNFLKTFLPQTKNAIRAQLDRNCRIVNAPNENLDSGKIFGEKLLKKGIEFLVWGRGDSFLLARTVANQNLRNYTIRDYEKKFRDSKMGMLPPKLAQILINLANPDWTQTIIDPFCGSGTVNIEAAIMGYKTIGSDISKDHIREAQENFKQISGTFRYDVQSGEFLSADATTIPFSTYENASIVTEGFLGKNFEDRPSLSEIEKNEREILSLWEKIFLRLEKAKIQRIVFCLPAWRVQQSWHSISSKLFAKIQKNFYTPGVLFEGKETFLYFRPDAFVAREICVMERK